MFNRDRCYDRENEMMANFAGDNNVINNEMNMDVDVNMMGMEGNNIDGGPMNRPLVEPMQERCVHRTIMHEVPQV